MTNRRQFMYNSGLGILALATGPMVNFKHNFSIPAGFIEIRNGIGYYEGRGGTMGWMNKPDGIVAIDSQFPKQAENFVSGMAEMNERKIDTLINTHHHRDHTSGNPVFANYAYQIVSHDNSLKNQRKAAERNGLEAEQTYPNETFSDRWRKRFKDEIITAKYHGPAHTDGDIIIHFEEANVAHMGDLVFNRRYPYIDKSAGANIENWIQVLDNALDYFDAETRFIFGHADNGYTVLGSKDDISAFQNYLSMLLKYMEVQMRAGKDLDTILAETDHIPGAPEWKGDGISRSIKAVFQEFSE